MDEKILIGLRPGIKTPFVRTVRDEKQAAVEMLEFRPGIPVEIENQLQFNSVMNDIGNVLVVIVEGEDGQVKACRESTVDMLVQIAQLKKKGGAELAKFQREALAEYETKCWAAKEAERLSLEATGDDDSDDEGTEFDDSSIESINELIGELEVMVNDESTSPEDVAAAKKDLAILRGKRTRLAKKIEAEAAGSSGSAGDDDSDDEGSGDA